MNTEVKTATLSQLRPPAQQSIDALPSVSVGLTSLQGFELAQRAAKLLASSTIVPKEYQNNVANCTIALNMAARIGADPLMVMQNLVIVHGKPTWSSQFLISTVNTCGRFTALRYEFFGDPKTDDWGCRAWAIEKATGEKLVGTDVTISIAKKEGWFGKNGSKWQTIPQQMLMYRAGSWWTRAYAPELSMGLHTQDEMQDVYDASRNDEGVFVVESESLRRPIEQEESSHNSDTGEIIEGNAVVEAAQPSINFTASDYDLTTKDGAKAAGDALLVALKDVAKDDRLAAFVSAGGAQVAEALKTHSLALYIGKFQALSIKI